MPKIQFAARHEVSTKRRKSRRRRTNLSARRFAHEQPDDNKEQNARQSDDKEHRLPRLDRTQHRQLEQADALDEGDHNAAKDQCGTHAEIDPGGINAHRPRAFIGRKIVRDHGIRRRRQACLANADKDPGQEQGRETAGKPAGRRRQAPQQDTHGNQLGTVPVVGEARDKDADKGIEEGKREAVQQADIGVGQVQIGLDRRDEQRNDHAIDERKDIERHQHDDDEPRVAPVGPCAILRDGSDHRFASMASPYSAAS